MAQQTDKFIEKEVVLTIRVPEDFDREDEKGLDDEFAAILEKQGWELVNSKEYRDLPEQSLIPVNRVTITRERYSENEAWSDHFWVDASKTPSVELFRDAVQAYLKTEAGKVAINATCEDFNWGDAIIYVPTEAWNESGIYPFDFHHTPQEMGLVPTSSDNLFTFTVDQDEVLIPDDSLEQEENPTIIPADGLPDGWTWHHYPDASGFLRSLDGKSYFSYDRATYFTQGGVEYKETKNAGWSVFWGTFDEFKAHAEQTISQKFLPHSFDEAVKAAELRSTEQLPAFPPQPKEPGHEH